MEHHGQLTGNPSGLQSEIIIKIFARLPVKSLCRFKCVSKPWRSLLSDHSFVKVHFNKAIENEDVLHQRRTVIFTAAEDKSLYSLHLDEFLNSNDAYLNNDHVDNVGEGDLVAATELAFVHSVHRETLVSLIYHCNGLLLCQLGRWDLYLINPATRESKILPRTPKPYRYSSLCGFGFDHSTDEHKVVCGRINRDHGIEFCVYTLETNSWRVIRQDFSCVSCTTRLGIHVNGDLHWLMNKDDHDEVDENPSTIMSLLLAKEEVREIPLPHVHAIDGDIPMIELGVFREWLCIINDGRGDGQTYNEFWVMKEHGVKESWTKMRVSIPYHQLSHSGFCTKSHDLMVFNERLVMYSFDDESSKDLSICGIEKVGSCVAVYLDSLVSLRNRPKTSLKKTSMATESQKNVSRLKQMRLRERNLLHVGMYLSPPIVTTITTFII